MSQEGDVRMGWLRVLYWYTVVGAGAIGLGILFAPGPFGSVLRMPS
jgi:hypothetical protein